MYNKFIRKNEITVLSHTSSVKRRPLCFFQRIQVEKFVLETGLIIIYRRNNPEGGFSIEVRKKRSIYIKKSWADTLFNWHFPNTRSYWKNLYKAIEIGGRAKWVGSDVWVSKRDELLTISDSETFNISFSELSQILYTYHTLRAKQNPDWQRGKK